MVRSAPRRRILNVVSLTWQAEPVVTGSMNNRVEARRWFNPVAPPEGFAWAVACSWSAVPDGLHRLTPDGCADVVCLSDETMMLCGPERRSWNFQLANGITAVGVRLRPGMANLVFGIDVSTIVDRRVAVHTLIGSERAACIRTALGNCETIETRRRVLVEQIADLTAADAIVMHPIRQFIDTILNVLVERPRATRTDLAQQCAVSVRELHRRSLCVFGYGTSTLARIMRFQHLLALTSVTQVSQSLASLAVEAGYCDQAHLAHDCRAITSLTPRAFLGEYFPTFPDLADPYKTRTPLVARLG